MKTAISISDDAFADAERLARQLKISRSQLYTRAIREYIARHAADHVTETLNRICADLKGNEISFASAASRRILRRTEW